MTTHPLVQTLRALRMEVTDIRERTETLATKYADKASGKTPPCPECDDKHLKGVPGFCPACHFMNASPPLPCPTCNGSGRVLEPVETYSYSEFDMCPTCKATGTKP